MVSSPPRFLTFLVAMLCASQASAQNEYLVGRKVMTIKWDTEAREGTKVVRKLELAEVYEVTKVNGQWLWFSEAVGGWVRRSDVVPFEQAIDHFNRLVQQNPTRTNFYHRALAWQAKGELDIALGDLNESLRLDPVMAVYNSRGILWKAKGEYDRAIADYNEAIRLDPKYAAAYNNRGVAWDDKGEHDRAIADYNEAIRLDPKYATAYNNRATTWKAKGEYDRAIADYNEAIRLDPQHALAFLNRGNAWKAKGEYDRALADYREAIRLDPIYAQAHYNLGDLRFRRGELDKALESVNEALRFQPNNILWLVGRGKVLNQQGNYDRAIADYRKAIRNDPKLVAAHNSLAWLLATCPDQSFRDGNRAVQLAIKACELTDWNNWHYIDTLAAAHAREGNFEEAVKRLKQARVMADGESSDYFARCLKLYESGEPYVEEPSKSD